MEAANKISATTSVVQAALLAKYNGCSGANAGYCEGCFFFIVRAKRTKNFVDHAHFCVGHAPSRSRLPLNHAAARKTTKKLVSFLIVAVVNKAKTPNIM